MKIFNKGARDFLFHGVRIVPDKFTDLSPLAAKLGGPEKLEEAGRRLLAAYPNELIAGEAASSDAKAAIGRASQLEKENGTLRGQVEKLQKLLVASDEEKDAALREALARAEKAEADLAEARDVIAEAHNAAEAAETRIAPLERQLAAATAARAEGSEATAPAAHAAESAATAPAPAAEEPAPAAAGGKKKSRNS